MHFECTVNARITSLARHIKLTDASSAGLKQMATKVNISQRQLTPANGVQPQRLIDASATMAVLRDYFKPTAGGAMY